MRPPERHVDQDARAHQKQVEAQTNETPSWKSFYVPRRRRAVAEACNHARDRAHPSGPVWEPNRGQVLGGLLRRTRHRSHRILPWRQRPAARTDQRVLQRSHRWKVRPQSRPHGPGTRNHGLRAFQPVWTDLPSRQFRLWTDRSRKQLGQGTLHRRRRTHRFRAGRGAQGSRVLRLPARFPGVPLPGRRHGVRHGHPPDLQDPGRVSRSHDVDFLRGPLAQGLGHRGGALQRHPVRPPAGGKRRRVHGPGQRSPV
mmetsp:Transcript_7108/g.44013  ORF Transcript_7108/g.44013 Transcript_7108/m.44013 type:complete len:255 (-) Transcript_7108:2728-3492(-)